MTDRELADMRARLVGELRARGDVRTPRVATAFGRVARHVFVDGAPADVYTDRAIAIKLDGDVPISSSSQPAVMAQMLEMLELRGGERVLEIGTGSGYNAALLAELVGPHGMVTTVDIDAELVASARRHLDEAGYALVRTIVADGAAGEQAGAPFDAIVATVGVEQVPSAWIDQLRAGGRLVTPLTTRTLQKVVSFERTIHGLESSAVLDAGFIMLRGPSATQFGRTLALGEPATALQVLALNAGAVEVDAIVRALRTRAHDTHPVRHLDVRDAWDGFMLWLAVHDDAFCRASAHGETATGGPIPNLVPGGAISHGIASTFGLVSGGELVVLAARGQGDVMLRRFGSGAGLTERLQSALLAWTDAGRPGNSALRIAVDPEGAARISVRTA